MPEKKTVRTCKNGHQFYKSSDCPTCPVCEAAKKPKDGFLSLLSAPANRALTGKGLTSLKKLSATTKKEILSLHGVGPATIPTLAKAMAAEGLSFKEEKGRQVSTKKIPSKKTSKPR